MHSCSHAGNNCNVFHARNTTAMQINVILAGMYLLLVAAQGNDKVDCKLHSLIRIQYIKCE